MYTVLIRLLVIVALLVVGCGGSSSSESPNPNPVPGSQIDTDKDGVPDSSDAFPENPNESADLDGDGTGDNEDIDDDNDGLADDEDPNPRALIKKANVTALFHTENPETITGPVKVLFAIDCSGSMYTSDPPDADHPAGRRISAVRAFIDQFNTEDYPTVSFGIVLWSANILGRTINEGGEPGFTRSTEELNRVLDTALTIDSADYLTAMATIRPMVEDDIRLTSDQESGAAILSRSKYIVCFLSDGAPNSESGTQNDSAIWSEVEQMNERVNNFKVGAFNFHTFLLSTKFRDSEGIHLTQPPELVSDRQNAEAALIEMAKLGNGNYQDFAKAEAINFSDFVHLRLADQYTIKYVVAYNHMVRPHITKDTLVLDSDGDGLTDVREVELGTDPSDRDTDDDGLNDGFEISIQTIDGGNGDPWPDPLTADSNCPPSASGIWPDQDGDGLTDCEERVKKTSLSWADSDDDYIPDGIEVAAGTNPLENSYPQDSDLDSMLDVFEVRGHTNVLVDDPILRDRYAYHYSMTDHGSPDPITQPELPLGIRRYSIEVSNIGLVDTLGAAADDIYNSEDGMNPGDNVIRIYIAQVPEDRPNDPAVFRMAQVVINFHDAHDVALTPADFKMLP